MRKWFSDQPLQAITVLGVVLYGSFRLDYFLFYGHFNVTPEEVGSTYASTLAQSLLGALLLVLTIGLPLAVVIGFYAVLVRQAASHTRRTLVERGARFVILCGVGVVVVATLTVEVLHNVNPQVFSFANGVDRVVVTLVAIVMSWGITGVIAPSSGKALEPPGEAIKKFLRPGLWTFGAMSTLCLLVLLPSLARLDAQAVEQGFSREAQLAGWLNLSWGADVAKVHWTDPHLGTGVGLDQDCVMYLGRSEGIVVLYEPRERRVLRVPHGAVIVTVRNDLERCDFE